MSLKFIEKNPKAAIASTGMHAGIGWDSTDECLYINPEGTRYAVALQKNAEVVAATNVLTAEENGKTCFLNHATEFVSTLPAPALGLSFTFVVSAAPAGADYTVYASGGSNIIVGHVVSSQDAGGTSDSETTGGDTVSFVASKAVVGDKAVFVSDGTSWFVSASCKVFDAITITTAA